MDGGKRAEDAEGRVLMGKGYCDAEVGGSTYQLLSVFSVALASSPRALAH